MIAISFTILSLLLILLAVSITTRNLITKKNNRGNSL